MTFKGPLQPKTFCDSFGITLVVPCSGDTALVSCGRSGSLMLLQRWHPSLPCCVNSEGGICNFWVHLQWGWVVTDSAGYGRVADWIFYCSCQNYIWKTEKKKKPTAVVRLLTKRTSAEFSFPVASVCLDCFCSKKQVGYLCLMDGK